MEIKKKPVSRQEFIKGAAAGAAGSAVMGTLASCTPAEEVTKEVEPWLPAKWDMEADVLIVGSGLAGLSAAIEAGRAGAGVLILEQYGLRGSLGRICACGTKWQAERGIKDSVDLMFADWIRSGNYKCDPELVRILCEQSADGLYFLETFGATCTDVKLGEDTVIPRAHVGFHEGPVLGQSMLSAIEKNGGKLMLNTRFTELFREGYLEGRVVGARAVDKYGKEFTIKAKRAIIIATGLWTSDNKMILEEWPTLPKEILRTDVHGKSGAWADAVRAGQAINASMRHMAFICLGPYTSMVKGVAFLTRAPQEIHINLKGERYVDESANRGKLGEAVFSQPKRTYFVIQDSNPKILEMYMTSDLTMEQIDKWVKAGQYIRANTIKELADALEKAYGVPADAVVKTVTNYNKYCETGVDLEFGKPKESLVKLEVPPFYSGVPFTCSITRTLGGFTTDAKTQALDINGVVIPGLYVVGMASGGHQGQYMVTGNQQCAAMVFGRIAGKEVAALKPSE